MTRRTLIDRFFDDLVGDDPDLSLVVEDIRRCRSEREKLSERDIDASERRKVQRASVLAHRRGH